MRSPPELQGKKENPPALSRKKNYTERFVKEYKGKMLPGMWFYRQMKDGTRRVHLYCADYDNFLARAEVTPR